MTVGELKKELEKYHNELVVRAKYETEGQWGEVDFDFVYLDRDFSGDPYHLVLTDIRPESE